MLKNLIKIMWIGTLVCYVLIYILFLREAYLTQYYTWALWIGAIGLAFWSYVTVRAWLYKRKFELFARHLLDGDYETGIQTHRFSRDEMRTLADLTNRIADRLRLFDKLRAERVALSTRAREILHERSDKAVIVAEFDGATFRFNEAARSLFGIDQESMSFESIENRPENREFTDFFRNAVEKEKVECEARVKLTLPVRDITREVAAEIVPIKDNGENVRIALIFLK